MADYGMNHDTKEDLRKVRQVSGPVQVETKNFDAIEVPEGYNSHPSGVEAIEITQHFNFCLGNVIKYVWRAEHKGGIEDLKKARQYLNYEIARLEKESK